MTETAAALVAIIFVLIAMPLVRRALAEEQIKRQGEDAETPEHSSLVSTGSTNDEASSTGEDEETTPPSNDGITPPGDTPLPEP